MKKGINKDLSVAKTLLGRKKEKCTMKRLIKTATLLMRRGGDVKNPM